MKKESVTISTVAKQAGVSKTTISRYLNGKYEYMSSETKARIEEVIDELNYRPNSQAQTLKSKRSYLLGVMIADIENVYSSLLLKGISQVCHEKGYQLMIMNADNSLPVEEAGIKHMVDQHIDGLLIQSVNMTQPPFSFIEREGIPAVLFDRQEDVLKYDTVTSNNYEVTSKLTKMILEKGYEQVVFVTEKIEGISTRQIRMKAVMDTCAADKSEGTLFEIQHDEGYNWQQELYDLIKTDRKTALFAGNESVLFELLKAKGINQLFLTKEIGLVAFDDLGWSEVVEPGISVIKQNPLEIGRQATLKVIKRITEPEKKEPKLQLLEAEIIVRNSF